MSNQHHLANRSKTDLSKKVEHNAPPAQRSLKSAANAADRIASSVGNAITSSVESFTSSAANDHGAKTAQTITSAASTGGRVVKTTLKTSVNVVAKVPEAVKRARIENTRGFKRARNYARRKMTLRQKFRPKALGYAIGGSLKISSGLADGVSSGLRKAIGSGDGTGASAMGIALSSGRAIKTGSAAAARSLKTTRKIATKVEHKITNVVKKRVMRASAKAASKAAGESAKASLQMARIAKKFTEQLELAAARFLSQLISSAPIVLVAIGVIILIILAGGAFMFAAFKQ